LGLKIETAQKPDIPIISPDYDLHEVKGADILVDDKAPEEPLIVWDEKKASDGYWHTLSKYG
jgi:hypothetical protein